MYKELTDDEIIELYDRMQNRQIAGETQHSIALDFGIPDPYISRYMKKVPNIMKRREKLQKEITPDNLEITQSYSDNIVIAENQQNNK